MGMPSPGSSPVCTIGSGVFQQHAVRSCQTTLWCPSRFCTGACSSHTLHYPSGLRHWPSQFESPRPINSAFPGNIRTLLKTTYHCYSHMKNWMTQNKLQLNDEKTEAMLAGTRQKLPFYFRQHLSAWRHHSPTLWPRQKPRRSPREHTVHGERH